MKLPFNALLAGLLLAVCAAAHPMGNFSVSHYARLDFNAAGLRLTYVLDLAEIPTLELFQEWRTDGKDEIQLQRKAAAQADAWLRNLSISVNGMHLVPQLEEMNAKTTDGAGGMLVLRVAMKAVVAAAPGQLLFEDRNYANRTGWKEIVLRGTEGVSLAGGSHSDQDISHELTAYPSDPTLAPPQDLVASARWSATEGIEKPVGPGQVVISGAVDAPTSVTAPLARPASAVSTSTGASSANMPATASTFAERQSAGPGSVVKGDFLSVMLRDRKFGLGSILFGLLVAFGLGAMHALSPGHGKTIVAAYLVGSRGTLKHALFLGSMVTFTHTISVFLLGLGVLFFQKYVVPDQIIPVLGTVSGLSIVCIGSWLLYARAKALMETGEAGHVHAHHHDHDHHHDHLGSGHHHEHPHEHHHESVHTHTHDGRAHSHAMPDGRLTLGGLIALGASGGLVPCPSALILLLSAIALGHTALGLGLLAAFSVGLAVVLMGIGAIVLFAKRLLPARDSARSHPLFRLVPVFSSVVVIMLGLLMTLAALGWIGPIRAFGAQPFGA
jgi:nickel/cobalt transporter (NicO) family protein